MQLLVLLNSIYFKVIIIRRVASSCAVFSNAVHVVTCNINSDGEGGSPQRVASRTSTTY
jgi:hypothetical protein